MKRPVIIILIAALATSALAWHLSQPTKTTSSNPNLKQVTLRQEWFPNSNYAGALFASRQFAERRGIKLEIQSGSATVDPVKLVISGDSTFGDAAADKIIAANEKGADLVVVGVLNNDNPTVFLAMAAANIQTPFDFAGKKIGVLEGTSTAYAYRLMLSKLRLDASTFKEVDIPFELATFVAGAYDVRPAFAYDEPVHLELRQIRFTTIRPSAYGVSLLGTVYFTRRKVVDEQPELVQNFISSVAEGWVAAMKYPSQAMRYLKEFDSTIDEKRELLSLQKSESYFRGHEDKVLLIRPGAWEGTVDGLRQLGVIRAPVSPRSLEMKFVNEFHKGSTSSSNRSPQ